MSDAADRAAALLKRLALEGVRLWMEGDQLRFRAASGALTAADIDELRLHRAAVKTALLDQGCLFVAYPTSDGQRAQWFIHEFLGAADPAYHLLAAVKLRSGIGLPQLQAAINGLIERHEILRSRYLLQAGVLWQAAEPARHQPLPVHLIEAGEAPLQASVDAFAAAAFDLRQGAVFRAALFEQPGETAPQHVLAVAVHHIASDFLSLQELLLDVQHRVAGEPLQPAAPFRQAVRHPEADEDRARRINALSALLQPVPEVTHVASRDKLGDRGGHAVLRWERGGDEARRLLAAAASLGVTPFSICLAAFSVAASSLLRRESFGINLAVAAPRAAGTLGDFANFIPFVARVRRADRMDDIVASTFATSHKLLQFGDIPFRDVVARLGIAGGDPISPFSHLAFAWHRESARNARAGAKLGEILPMSRQLGAPGGLMLTGREQRAGFSFSLVYRDGWLSGDGIRRFQTCFDAALTAIVEQRGSAVSSVVGPDEQPADERAAGGDAGRGADARVARQRGERGQIAETVRRLVCNITGAAAIEAETSIFDLGITSISLIDLRGAIRATLDVDMSLSTLFELATVEAIAGWIAGEEVDLPAHAADMALPVPRRCAASADGAPPRRILLTGATGFLGTRLLRRLLDRPEILPLCLVRAPDARTAELKLRRSLASAGIVFSREEIARVTIVPGHVGSGRLGQNDAEYDRLAHAVDTVIHASAQVNFALPYQALRGNALGALEIARLCMEGKPKPLHFVSTYSLLDPSEPVNAERLEVPEHPFLELGYARSKWVAERLLLRAGENGLRCRIYRPSRIIPGRVGDPLNRHDFYSLLLAGSAAARAVPTNAGFDNFVDVAGVAAVIADAATRPIFETRAVHLCAGAWTAWSEIVGLLDGVAPNLARLDYPIWVERVLTVAAGDPALAGLTQLRPFLVGQADRLRTCLLHRHPEIEREAARAWPALDVRFDHRLIADHYAQITGPEQNLERA